MNNKDYSKYTNYEFEYELSDDFMAKKMIVHNFEIIANNTNEQIAIQVKNNNDVDISYMAVSVAYFKNNKIVGCELGLNDTTIKANSSGYINVDYPEDDDYNKVKFDSYKAYILNADK